jgi:hypothetical protein
MSDDYPHPQRIWEKDELHRPRRAVQRFADVLIMVMIPLWNH